MIGGNNKLGSVDTRPGTEATNQYNLQTRIWIKKVDGEERSQGCESEMYFWIFLKEFLTLDLRSPARCECEVASYC